MQPTARINLKSGGKTAALHKMLVREYRDSDFAALRAIHAAQGFDYALPDLSNPLFVTKLVLTNENVAAAFRLATSTREKQIDAGLKAAATQITNNDTVCGAALLRLTAEAYLLLDPHIGTPRERWQCLRILHAATEHDAWRCGLEDVHAWLPPRIAQKFGKRLTRLGWRRDDAWTPYCKQLAAR